MLITADFLWITLGMLCVKLVQTCGEVGEICAQICGQLAGRKPKVVGTLGNQPRKIDRLWRNVAFTHLKTTGDLYTKLIFAHGLRTDEVIQTL